MNVVKRSIDAWMRSYSADIDLWDLLLLLLVISWQFDCFYWLTMARQIFKKMKTSRQKEEHLRVQEKQAKEKESIKEQQAQDKVSM